MLSPIKRYFEWPCAASIAFVATVALGYLSALWSGTIGVSQPGGAWCFALGAVYAILGTIDYAFFRYRVGAGARVLYLCAQAGLLLAILWTSRLSAQMFLCAFPLVAASVVLLPPLGAALAVAALFGMVMTVEDYFYGHGSVLPYSISLLPALGFVVIFTRIAVREKAARARAESLSDEVGRLAVIRERNRLAREIHDSLGHYLTTLHVQLEAARTIHAEDPVRALEAVAKAQGLARDALVEVRRSVGALQADSAPAPLTERLRDLAAATDGLGAKVSIEVLGTARNLAPEAEHALFRAAQEGLTNVRKHAHARTAAVIMDYRDAGRVLVRVTDDGRGAASAPAGHGIGGLRQRIAALGGTVVAGNPAEGGFCLQVEIPS